MELDINLTHPKEYNLSKIEAKLVTIGFSIEDAEQIAKQILDDAYNVMLSNNSTGQWN